MPSFGTPISAAELRGRFPELAADHPDALLTESGNVAALIDSTRREATLYLAAHLAVCWRQENTAEPDGGSGVVLNEREGPRSVSYMAMSEAVPGTLGSSDSFYERSSYGRTYMVLRASSPRRTMPFVVE